MHSLSLILNTNLYNRSNMCGKDLKEFDLLWYSLPVLFITKGCQTVNKAAYDALDVYILMQFSTRLQKSAQCLQVKLIREHLKIQDHS